MGNKTLINLSNKFRKHVKNLKLKGFNNIQSNAIAHKVHTKFVKPTGLKELHDLYLLAIRKDGANANEAFQNYRNY